MMKMSQMSHYFPPSPCCNKFLRLVAILCVSVCSVCMCPGAEAMTKPPVKTSKTAKTKKTTPPARSSKKPQSAKKTEKPRTSGEIRKEKKKTDQEIARTKEEIAANDKRTRRQLSRLGELDAQIKESTAKVNGLKVELDTLRSEVKALSDTVATTEQTVQRLQEAYSRNLTAMRRQRQGVSDISFIFSAENFSSMVSRARYLKELSRAQSSRARQLKERLAELKERKARLDTLEARLSATLKSHKRENALLETSRASATVLMDSLKRQGSSLKKVLQEKQALARRLDAELDRIIAEEARRAAEEEARRKKAEEEARKKAEASGKNNSGSKQTPKKGGSSPVDVSGPTGALSGGFAANKGALPWPVDRTATVVGEFGRSSHPELARVDIQNNGIDIRSSAGASARAVFRGTVSSIFRLDGYNNIVILRHGDYLTVYAGLSDLKVRKGQDVTAGQILGSVSPDSDDPSVAVLHFEIRHEKQKLNPRDWLRK